MEPSPMAMTHRHPLITKKAGVDDGSSVANHLSCLLLHVRDATSNEAQPPTTHLHVPGFPINASHVSFPPAKSPSHSASVLFCPTTMASHHPVAEANDRSPFGSLSPDEFYARYSVAHASEFITNSRGMKLFTQWWAPLPPTKPIGIIAVVHGFTGESSWLIQLTAVYFTKAGFATCAIDHQGHGFSDGLVGHIPDINPVVEDCIAFFGEFRARYPPSLPAFLYAESLGGAISLLITLRQKERWDGVILNGAMCGISPKFKPPWPLEHFLSLAAALIPTWRVVPTRGSIPDVSFKVEWKRRLAIASPNRKVAMPRAATAHELVRVCKELQGRFEEVEVPFLISHGGEDVVCDPSCVEELYKLAASKDKTLKIYPNMWHQMIGEVDEDVDLVFGDMLDWLRSRVDRPMPAV